MSLLGLARSAFEVATIRAGSASEMSCGSRRKTEIWYGAPGGDASNYLVVTVLGIGKVEWFEEVKEEHYEYVRRRWA